MDSTEASSEHPQLVEPGRQYNVGDRVQVIGSPWVGDNGDTEITQVVATPSGVELYRVTHSKVGFYADELRPVQS